MVSIHSPNIDVTPLLVGWQILSPVTEPRFLPAGLLLIAALAVAIRLVMREVRPSSPQRVLIVGSSPMATKLATEVEAASHPRYVVAGIVADRQPDDELPQAPRWLGPCDRLADAVERVRPACIVLAAGSRRDHIPTRSLLESRVRGIPVEDVLEFYERLTGKIAIEALRPMALIMSKGFRNHGAAEALARVLSLVAASIGLIVVAPLLMALAIAIKLDSRGPVLFVQPRAGRGGRPFGLVKFRTMHPCTDARSEWVTDNLDRITPVGRWLRRFRLDELPQLVNVLRGEMNLIGPRPHPTANHDRFVNEIAYYELRDSVRPGVTGWAQVRYGYANNLEEETEKMRYDLFYIKNWSLLLDARILFETVGIMIFGQGASTVRRPSPSRSELLPAPPRRHAHAARAVARPRRDGERVAAYMPSLPDFPSPRPAAGRH